MKTRTGMLVDTAMVLLTFTLFSVLSGKTLGACVAAAGERRPNFLFVYLLTRYPKLFPKGKTLDEMALNIDLAPTFLELAGIPVPRQMQGRSWMPLLTGNKSEWRTSFLAEYFVENNFPTTPTVVMVRTTTAKLIKYPGHDEWTELFDLVADPYETKNLVQEPASKELLVRMNAEFDAQVKATGYVIPDYADKPGALRRPSRKEEKRQQEKEIVNVVVRVTLCHSTKF